MTVAEPVTNDYGDKLSLFLERLQGHPEYFILKYFLVFQVCQLLISNHLLFEGKHYR